MKKRSFKKQARQGDVFIEVISDDEFNKKIARLEAQKNKTRAVFAYGEVTGHAHAIYEPNKVEVYSLNDGSLMVKVKEDTELKHEEHSTIPMSPGTYHVRQKREWTDANEPRAVADQDSSNARNH